jgi:hypothetical protein
MGVFMDQIQGAPSLNEIKIDNDCSTFAQWCIDALPAAANQFEIDLLASITGAAKMAKNAYKGDIGQTGYSGSLKPKQPVQFLKITGIEDTDAEMKVNGGRIFVNTVGSYDWAIYKELPYSGSFELLNEGTFTATRTGANAVNFGLTGSLPLAQDGVPLVYYFAWQRTGSAAPYDNDVDCGCSSGPGYGQYIIVQGGEAVDFSSMPAIVQTDRRSHGIQLNVLISCKASNVICKNMESNEAIKAVIANMIAFKANMIVIQKILDTNSVNRYTMMSRDAQYGKLSQFKAEYSGRMQHLILVFDTTLSDCYECKPAQVWKGTIFS